MKCAGRSFHFSDFSCMGCGVKNKPDEEHIDWVSREEDGEIQSLPPPPEEDHPSIPMCPCGFHKGPYVPVDCGCMGMCLGCANAALHTPQLLRRCRWCNREITSFVLVKPR
jgi:hypothetical protein